MTGTAWDPLADLSAAQSARLSEFARALVELNRRVNLVSPSTTGDVYERHLVHSLALAHRAFPAGATIVDWGAGGGLPSIPLAIRFPDVRFVAVDATAKKTEAIRLFRRRLDLPNLEVWNGRAEEWPGRADYAVSRATAPLADLWRWFARVRTPARDAPTGTWAPGLVCLKGGDLDDEVRALAGAFPEVNVERTPLGGLLGKPYFQGKEIVAAW